MNNKRTIGQWGSWSDDGLRVRILELKMELESASDELKQRGKIKHARFTRSERSEQIKRILRDGQIRTTSQIAKELGMSPSQHLRDILCELYRDGTILGYAESTVARHPVYHWYVQGTLPLPSPDFQRTPLCESIAESVGFPF